ncbi:hypothetical protein [Desulfosporosinus shakirovi]|uniref:hypothetical protein n=1 Tax=Desulfosporosinus shakirovi TaxID=2885154 RepID=UPI001E62E790|nr:hypothetical protein [Desulfosporosinus sp. SRJS8]MCB8818323.1 hypothetical protein [Desulfosporosinus sp. SRJS8]
MLLVGLTTSFTDMSRGKIYNKHLLKFFPIIMVIDIANVVITKQDHKTVLLFIVNFLIGTVIAILLYYWRAWAGGDAKLFSLVLLIVPNEIYPESANNIFPGFWLLVSVFSIGFLYILTETVYLLFKDLRQGRFQAYKNPFPKGNMVIPRYIFSFMLVLLESRLLVRIFPSQFLISNLWITYFVSILTILAILKFIKSTRTYIILAILSFGVLFIFEGNAPWLNYKQLVGTVLTATAIVFMRSVGNFYNYKEIPTSQVSAGNILAFDTVLMFQRSKISGLPQFTDETTKSRLSIDEVQSIKRWETSKFGFDKIRIVRHIPFAPFIFLGSVLIFLRHFIL